MNLNVKGIILKLTKKKHRRKFQIDNIKIKTFNLQIHHMEWKDRPPTRRYLQCIYSVKDQCYQFPSLKRQTNRKWLKGMIRYFTKGKQMVQKHTKRFSTSLTIKEIQIKTTMTPFHTHLIGTYQEVWPKQVLDRTQSNYSSYTLLINMYKLTKLLAKV